jgi:imidazolonepropionase
MSFYKLITNIKQIVGIDEQGVLLKKGKEMEVLGKIDQAFILIENNTIHSFGSMDDLEASIVGKHIVEEINASNCMVLPSFVDSHTHLVFAKWREEEFEMRIKGKTYEEIAEAGGGILNSAKKLQTMSENDLYEQAYERLWQVIRFGTGAIEIKSGYGLTVADEIKMLRVIARLKQASPIAIKSTFLGAHAFPAEYKNNHQGYIDLIVNEMMPNIAAEGLADYFDVFCDKGFYSVEETDALLNVATKYSLKAKIHGNELGYTGGVQVAVKHQALSVDHLEYTGDEEIACLLNSKTMPVGLPNCSFFLGIPYMPARKMIDAGLPVCLASDYNPGSSPNGRMGFVVSLACTQMKLTPHEAINATTINGAYALELSQTHGSIAVGKRANLIITKPISSLAYLPYNFGDDCVGRIIVNGQLL